MEACSRQMSWILAALPPPSQFGISSYNLPQEGMKAPKTTRLGRTKLKEPDRKADNKKEQQGMCDVSNCLL